LTSQNLLQDDVIEDNGITSIENDDSEDQVKQDNHVSLFPHVASAPTISSNIDVPTKIVESSSLGKELKILVQIGKSLDLSRRFSDNFIKSRKEKTQSMYLGNL
jgi:hypothetical protein